MARYQMQDDSVTVPGVGNPEYAGKSITRRGEDLRKENSEAGRYETEPAGPGQRPGGKSTARDSSSVNEQDPIDRRMPNLRTS